MLIECEKYLKSMGFPADDDDSLEPMETCTPVRLI